MTTEVPNPINDQLDRFLLGLQGTDSEITLHQNTPRGELITMALEAGEITETQEGYLTYVSAPDCKGRNPATTYFIEDNQGIDFDRMSGIPRDTFSALADQAFEHLQESDNVHILNRQIGTDSNYAHGVKVVTNSHATALFATTMIPELDEATKEESIFGDDEITMVIVPWDRIDMDAIPEHLQTSLEAGDRAVVMDMSTKTALILGDSYNGPVKKTPYTMYNGLLPQHGVLPMHCSANVGEDGDAALFFGLSGTGKTTLSADPNRPLCGDDEHGWSADGAFNFEGGCYAKTIDITEETEPEIWHAAHNTTPDQRALFENVAVTEDGGLDFSDTTLTKNGRVAYPREALSNIGDQVIDGPKNAFFLSYDAFGAMPPIARLSKEQAMLYYLLGYTSKVAGTEEGVTEPKATFSIGMGDPFFPIEPVEYMRLIQERLETAGDGTHVWLVNTGNNGRGERHALSDTRAVIDAALQGELDEDDFVTDEVFGFQVPRNCPGVESSVLNAKSSFRDEEAYDEAAQKLAKLFAGRLQELDTISPGILDALRDVCPGFDQAAA